MLCNSVVFCPWQWLWASDDKILIQVLKTMVCVILFEKTKHWPVFQQRIKWKCRKGSIIIQNLPWYPSCIYIKKQDFAWKSALTASFTDSDDYHGWIIKKSVSKIIWVCCTQENSISSKIMILQWPPILWSHLGLHQDNREVSWGKEIKYESFHTIHTGTGHWRNLNSE